MPFWYRVPSGRSGTTLLALSYQLRRDHTVSHAPPSTVKQRLGITREAEEW